MGSTLSSIALGAGISPDVDIVGVREAPTLVWKVHRNRANSKQRSSLVLEMPSNFSNPVAFYPHRRFRAPVKGKEWYQASDVAESYEDKRFSRGGQLIDRREREAVLDALGPVDGSEILEIAAGTGRFSVMLGEQGADVIGLDISGPMLQHGRAKAATRGVTDAASFIRGDAARLPFPDDAFDAVFAMRFFHLAPTPKQFLEEMCRVSRGPIIFDTFNANSVRSVYNWLLPMGSRLYEAREVHELLADTGLELEHVEHDFIVPYGVYRILPQLIAKPIRAVDRRVVGGSVGRRLASVSFWIAREADGSGGF